MANRRRKHISITADPDILAWVEEQIGPFTGYRDRSAVYEAAAIALMRHKASQGEEIPQKIAQSPMYRHF